MTARDDRSLWIAFAVLFAAVTVASVLPVHPIVVVFPAWSLVVVAAVLATVAVAAVAATRGWPAEGGAR